MRAARAMLLNFSSLILQVVIFLCGCAKYFACFSLPVKRLKVILWKDRKLQLLTLSWRRPLSYRNQSNNLLRNGLVSIWKNGLHSEIIFPPQFTTSLKSYLETCYILKFLTCNVQIIIYFNKGSSSSRAILKSILHVTKNVCHGEGLLIHVTVYNSAFFELSLARYTGWT